jgi:outer membrane beta-barrel protein
MAAACGLTALAEQQAVAQEILVTGPLAGAPAVREQRLRREGRFEIAPAVTFTLLDEYQRQIFFGARLQYNFTDWLAFGAWGAYSPDFVHIKTGLSEDIQDVNARRRSQDPDATSLNRRLTRINLGPDFTEQLGSMDWIAAPQITLVPFRGKIAIFQSIFVDTDLYLFGGPAFVGVKERGSCGPNENPSCGVPSSFERESRVAIAPTFGLGFSFYVNKWNAFGFEWRGVPFARNTGGFDNRGGDPDGRFPDLAVNEDDREFKFNQMLTVSYGFYFPTMFHVSE